MKSIYFPTYLQNWANHGGTRHNDKKDNILSNTAVQSLTKEAGLL